VKNKSSEARPRGRPRAFDRDEALGQAALAFWRLGYEGASIADLTQAMGITAQSLYAAFGSKAALYREALDWYRGVARAGAARAMAQEPDVITGFGNMLVETARDFSRPGEPPGCMISTAVLACATENQEVARHVAALRSGATALFRTRIGAGIAVGQLRADTDSEALARFLAAIVQGMSVQARDGADEVALLGIARLAQAELERHRA